VEVPWSVEESLLVIPVAKGSSPHSTQSELKASENFQSVSEIVRVCSKELGVVFDEVNLSNLEGHLFVRLLVKPSRVNLMMVVVVMVRHN
jgi:hypothetical protein